MRPETAVIDSSPIPPPNSRHWPAMAHPLVFAALGFCLALLPQAVYALTHDVGPGYGEWLAGWNPANLLRHTVSGPDGTSTYAQPMILFYLREPLWDGTDFLPVFYLPAIALGLATLIYQRLWLVLALL